MTPHFGFYQAGDNFPISLYYPNEAGKVQQEHITTATNAVDAEQLCDNLNRVIPLLKG